MTDTSYVRTDEELAQQQAYETREASLHGSAAQIHYRIIEGKPPGNVIVRKIGWRVGRQIGREKEVVSQWFFRRVEATDYLKDQMWKDNAAAKRLGVSVHLTASR